MITFISGALAAIAVGVTVWLVAGIIRMSKQVKLLEEQKQKLWLEIQNRCDSIERDLNMAIHELSERQDSSISYTDSRLDKLANHVKSEYVAKRNRLDNTIDYQ